LTRSSGEEVQINSTSPRRNASIDQPASDYALSGAHAPPAPGQLRAGEHSDLGMLTILTADNDRGGLQVKRRGGGWINVPVIEGAFIVNIGDLMMRWTNDRWVSTPHRVINPGDIGDSSSRRLSIGYFFNPNYDTEIACLPNCQTPQLPAKYDSLTVHDYRTSRFARTAGM
jgi:isopenicillin N synthase-like dioxygenase